MTDGAYKIQIFAGFDFQFDSLIAGAQFDGDLFEKHFGSCLQPYGNTAFDFRLRAAKQFGERKTLLLSFDVPESIFNSRAGHFVTPNAGENTGNAGGATELLSQNKRSEKSTNDQPSGVHGFGIEARTCHGAHFGPSADAMRENFNQNEGALVSNAKAGFKGGLQAHLEPAQSDGFNPHAMPVRPRVERSNKCF